MYGPAVKAIQTMMVWMVRTYQFTVGRILPPSCRFYPSCSEYARQSLIRHGPLKGLWRSVLRVCKCHPFHPGGVDLP